MKNLLLLSVGIFLLASCAPKEHLVQSDAKVYCKTHAREAAVSGSPDEEGLFIDCMHLKGAHQVEVK